MTKCTKPNCNCAEIEMEKQGTEAIKNYPCLAYLNEADEVKSDHTGTPKQQGAENHLEWWNSLSDDQEISILKQEGVYGHDQGVTNDEIKQFYIDSGCPAPVQQADTRSEGKETIEQAAERLSTENLIPDAISHWYKGGVKHGANWQAQHTDTAIAELKAALWQDKSGMAKALSAINKYLDGYSWIQDGRGPYAWDDDRYKEEVFNIISGVSEIASRALSQSGNLVAKVHEGLFEPQIEALHETIEQREDLVTVLTQRCLKKDKEIAEYKERIAQLEAENERLKK